MCVCRRMVPCVPRPIRADVQPSNMRIAVRRVVVVDSRMLRAAPGTGVEVVVDVGDDARAVCVVIGLVFLVLGDGEDLVDAVHGALELLFRVLGLRGGADGAVAVGASFELGEIFAKGASLHFCQIAAGDRSRHSRSKRSSEDGDAEDLGFGEHDVRDEDEKGEVFL